MPRPSNTSERRTQISDALIRVMAEHGYHGASIARIARAAGLASGLVLYHFESKSEILMHAVDALFQGYERRYRARLASVGDDPRARIHAFIDAQLALGPDADEAAAAAWVVVAAQAVCDADVRRLYARSVEDRLGELERLVRADLEANRKGARGAQRIAAAAISAIEGCLLLSAAAPGTLRRGYAAPTVRAMIDGLLDA
ncbi:MAG TPA: TetR/AcrR family transcriptional regulator [Kofleriaceae bacterium]|nr:TetR/AcrR family transcriptional regulator [Kofleriaceae bacterium]